MGEGCDIREERRGLQHGLLCVHTRLHNLAVQLLRMSKLWARIVQRENMNLDLPVSVQGSRVSKV